MDLNQDLTALPLDEKVGQLFFIGLPGPQLDERAKELLQKVRPGGVCLFARNIREREQTRELIDGIYAFLDTPAFISLDQEGGLVDRLRRVLEPMPAPAKFRQAADVRHFARLIAEAVRTLGFNTNFAPVVDVVTPERASFNNGLHSRAFGTSADEVIELAGTFLEELEAGGCIGCLKHFPGLGAAEVDSHEELPQVNIDGEAFESVDLRPYRHFFASGSPAMVMVAHAAFPAVHLQETGQNGRLLPSSLSPAFVSTLLRDRLGFKGVTVTDDLEMGAIVKNYGMGEACKMAVRAGEDMLAICAGIDAINEGFDAVYEAVRSGELDESLIDASVGRIAGLKQKISPPLPFSEQRLDEISAEIAELKKKLDQ